MAPSRLSQQRKRKRKKKDRSQWFLLVLVVILFLLFYLSSFVIDDSDLFFDVSEESNTKDIINRCRESCSEVILSRKREDIPSDSPPGALALSAFDALFSFREGDREGYSNSSQAKPQETKIIGSKNISNGKRTPISNQWDAYSNLSPRPNRLPPLIKTLVGTIDVNETFSASTLVNSKSGIRKIYKNKNRSTNGSGVEMSSRYRGGGGGSVAMVAAAAAAALWSESENRRGRLRMKAINIEWEASLRWISSWGQQQPGDKAGTGSSGSMNGSRPTQDSNRGSSRTNNRKRSVVHGNDAFDVGQSSDDYPDFIELLNACVAQCSGGSGEENIQDNANGRNDISESISDKSYLFSIIPTFKLILSCILFPYDFFRLQVSSKLMNGIFGMALSTIVMLGVRSIVEWRRNKICLDLFWEEETTEKKPLQKKTSKILIGKKSSVKKKKRRRRENRQHARYNSKGNAVTVNCEAREYISINSDSSIESRSSQEEILGTKPMLRNYDDYHSEDQATKGSTASLSSHVTFDVSRDDGIVKSKIITHNTPYSDPLLKHRNRRNFQCTKSHRRPLPEKNACLSPNQKVQVKVKPKKFSISPIEDETNKLNSPKSDQDMGSVVSFDNLSVPTHEQREEASRQLRQFQINQVEKYMRSRKTQHSLDMNTQSPKTVTSHSNLEAIEVLTMASGQTVSDRLINETHVSKSKSESISTLYLDGETDQGSMPYVGRSLLDMMDEGDDGVQHGMRCDKKLMLIGKSTNDGLFHSSVNVEQKTKDGRAQACSIALGGLLASRNNTTTSISSNPWCNESIDSTGGGTKAEVSLLHQSPTLSVDLSNQSQNLDKCTDANICLQVSAREFSPSWDGGNYQVNSPSLW